MAAFCGTCGKPLAPDARFCGGCGAPNAGAAVRPAPPQPTQSYANPPPAGPVKSGNSALKILLLVVLLGGAAVLMAAAVAIYFGKKKLDAWRNDSGVAAVLLHDSAAAVASARHAASRSGDAVSALLTKEEVGAIIGVPVTSIEMSGRSDATYKTASQGLDASIEVERKDDEADAVQSIEAARHVTQHAFGGKGDKIAGLGDDAVYGAFNVLYVRKNDMFLTIRPPNLQQAAQFEAYTNMASQPMGSDGQRKALEKLQETSKGDPLQGSLSKPDAVSGATDLIQHAATERGNEYETKARLMARQMAERVLAKIGT
jgi:hypothetical protein